MKIRSLGMFAIILVFTFSLFGCNTEAKKKDKLASFYKEYMVWMKTDDFKKALMDPTSKKGEEKVQELSKKVGLTDTELKDLDTKYKEDPEIKKLSEDMMKLAEEIGNKVGQEMQQQQQDQQQNQAPDGTQKAPTDQVPDKK